MPSTKTVVRSKCIMTEIVLPNDTNGLGNLMGGQLMHWMDLAAFCCMMTNLGKLLDKP